MLVLGESIYHNRQDRILSQDRSKYYYLWHSGIFVVFHKLPFRVADLCSTTQCTAEQKCVYDVTTGPKCVCRLNTDCSSLLNSLCGSDGRSYTNECIMKATGCREGRSIEKVKEGRCLPGLWTMFIYLFQCDTIAHHSNDERNNNKKQY